MKVKIVDVFPVDAFYDDRDVLVGLEGDWDGSKGRLSNAGGLFYLSEESMKLPKVLDYSHRNNHGMPVTFFYLYRAVLEEI